MIAAAALGSEPENWRVGEWIVDGGWTRVCRVRTSPGRKRKKMLRKHL